MPKQASKAPAKKKTAVKVANSNQAPMMQGKQPVPAKGKVKQPMPMMDKTPMPGTKTPGDKNVAILIKMIGKKTPVKGKNPAKKKKSTKKIGK